MQKHISFKAEFKRVLALLGPYAFLLAVGFGALQSHGSWSRFFNQSLKTAFWYSVLGWLALSLYIALDYKFRGDSRSGAGGGGGSSGNDDDLVTFNTNGLPMNGIHDSSGNAFGTSDD
jgi:hypothetical protein